MRTTRSKSRPKRCRTREEARAAALKRTKKKFRQLLNSREFDFYLSSEAAVVAALIDSVWCSLEKFLSIPAREAARYKRHLRAILLNLYAAYVADPNRYVALGLGKTSYSKRGRYSSLWASHGITTKVLSALRSKRIALLDMHSGMYDRVEEKGYRTRIRATLTLAQKFKNAHLRPDMISRASDYETVRLKDSDKTLIEYPDDANTITMRSNLALINTSLAESYVGLHVSDELRKGLDVADRQLYRVFNDGSFERGGRFFGGWWQSIPSELRRHIYVAHKYGQYPMPTRELDYSSMQPNLAYAMCGHAPPKDAYRIDVPKERQDAFRPVCKAAMLRMLNTPSFVKAIESLKRWYGENELPDDVPAAGEMVRLIEVSNPVLLTQSMFYRKAGKQLMYLESCVAENVMLQMRAKGAIALPVHDSFLVMDSYSEYLVNSMKDAIRAETGFDIQIKLDLTEGEYGAKEKRERPGGVYGEIKRTNEELEHAARAGADSETLEEIASTAKALRARSWAEEQESLKLEEIFRDDSQDRKECSVFWASFRSWLHGQPWYSAAEPSGDDLADVAASA